MNNIAGEILRIIIVVPNLPTKIEQIQGGVHSAVLNLLRGVEHVPGLSVRLVSLNESIKQASTIQLNPNVEIVQIPEGPFGYSAINYLLFGSSALKKQIREFRPHLLHYQIGGALLFTRFSSIFSLKHLITIHGIPSAEGKLSHKLKERAAIYFNGFIGSLLYPRNIIQICQYSEVLVAKRKTDHTTIISNAVSPRYFDIPDKQAMTNRLIYVGAVNDLKNQLFALKALKKLRELNKPFEIHFCGGFTNADYEMLVMDYINANQLQCLVKFHGWVSYNELPSILDQSDILIHTSRQEALPMVIAEAMAAGRFAIASLVGGIPEMITHGKDGFLVDLEKPEQTVEILSKLYNNDELTRSLGLEARSRAKMQFDATGVALKTKSFYQEILRSA